MASHDPNPAPAPEPVSNPTTPGNILLLIASLILISWLAQSCGIDLNIKRFQAGACRDCGADGKVSVNCIRCRGRGYYEGLKCEACHHTGKIEQTCRFCGGTGKKPK